MAFTLHSKHDYLQLALAALELKKKKVAYLGSDNSENSSVFYLIHTIVSGNNYPQAPFFVMDVGVVVSLWKRWISNLPMFRPFYAVKCNPDRHLLAALRSGFDCASPAEIEAVFGLGVPTDSIIYANPCKAEDHVKYAAEVEVNTTTFDGRDPQAQRPPPFHRSPHPHQSTSRRRRRLPTGCEVRGHAGRGAIAARSRSGRKPKRRGRLLPHRQRCNQPRGLPRSHLRSEGSVRPGGEARDAARERSQRGRRLHVDPSRGSSSRDSRGRAGLLPQPRGANANGRARALLRRDGLHIGGEHHREAGERRGTGVLDQRWVVWVIELFQAKRRSGCAGRVKGGEAIIEEVGCMPSSCVNGGRSNLCRSKCSVEGLSIAGARGEGLAGVPPNGSLYIFYYNQLQWFYHF